MLKRLFFSSALAAVSISVSAQWSISGKNVGEHQFTEKSSGVYELSLPNDTIFGKFVIKNENNQYLGSENTYVCGDVPYTLSTTGDSLMLASTIVNPVLTLNVNANTLTATGDIQPLYIYGDLYNAYWKSYADDVFKLDYQGNGVYSGKDLKMAGVNMGVLQKCAPDSINTQELRGDYVAPYRFGPKEAGTIPFDEPQSMVKVVRNQEKNFSINNTYDVIDVTVNMVDVTFEASLVKSFDFTVDKLYVIGANIAGPTGVVKWTDNGCNNGLLMNREESDNEITFSLSGVAIRQSNDDSENPTGEFWFASNLGKWDDIYEGACFGRNTNPLELSLNSSKKASCTLYSNGKWTTPIILPTGTYDFTITVSPEKSMTLTAVQTDTSAIEEISLDDTEVNTNVKWFDLNGRSISKPSKTGIYIRQLSDGTARKVIVK